MDTDFSEWVGRSVVRRDVVTDRLLAEFAATLGQYGSPLNVGLAPPGFHFGLAPAILDQNELGADGAEDRGLFIPPLPFARRMWAGGSIETLAPFREGERVLRRSTVMGVSRRDGRSGSFYIVLVLHEIEADGLLCVREEQQLVYRESISPKAPQQALQFQADVTWNVTIDPVALFRFSAFTFNGHRIHYDLDFARSQEGHAGLLVHGPLQATLLLNQFSQLQGSIPRHFTYRCLAPLVAAAEFQVESCRGRDGLAGRIVSSDGVVTCEARGPGTAAA